MKVRSQKEGAGSDEVCDRPAVLVRERVPGTCTVRKTYSTGASALVTRPRVPMGCSGSTEYQVCNGAAGGYVGSRLEAGTERLPILELAWFRLGAAGCFAVAHNAPWVGLG